MQLFFFFFPEWMHYFLAPCCLSACLPAPVICFLVRGHSFQFQKYVTTNQRTPFPEQVRYVLMDFTNVQNVDHSSSVIFHDIQQIACVSGITLIFTGMNQKVCLKLAPVCKTAILFRAASRPGWVSEPSHNVFCSTSSRVT